MLAKVGDKVKFLDTHMASAWHRKGTIDMDRVHTVVDVNSEYTYIINKNGERGGFNHDRFQLVEEMDMSENNEKYAIIVTFDAEKKIQEQAFKQVLDEAVDSGACTLDGWNQWMDPIESSYMEKMHSEKPDAKHTKSKKGAYEVGDWKYSKYLPAAYRSAKSVIGKAIDKGVPLFDSAGNTKGKSQLEKDCKASDDTPAKMPHEKVEAAIKVIRKQRELIESSTDSYNLDSIYGEQWREV